MGETKSGAMQRFLDVVETVGNKLPHPTIMFIWLVIAILILTAVLSGLNVVVETPTGEFPINIFFI